MTDENENGMAAGAAPEDKPRSDEILDWGLVTQIKTERKYIPKHDRWVVVRTSVPMDKMAAITAKFPGKSPHAELNRRIEMLKYIMVDPPVTDESARALAKADSGLMLEIIGLALGGLGESQLENDLPNA